MVVKDIRQVQLDAITLIYAKASAVLPIIDFYTTSGNVNVMKKADNFLVL